MRNALALCILAACSVAQDAHLIVVEEVSPSSVEAGGALVVEGRGFPSGRVGEARLRGRFVQPGEQVRDVDVPFEIRALSDGRCEAELDESAVSRLGGRGTFHGELWVRFEGVGESHVTGRQAIELDVGELGVDPVRTREQRQRDHQAVLGVTLDDDTSAGLRVAALTPDCAWEMGWSRSGVCACEARQIFSCRPTIDRWSFSVRAWRRTSRSHCRALGIDRAASGSCSSFRSRRGFSGPGAAPFAR